jgi:DNA-binding beta-propeller fold protein YncE
MKSRRFIILIAILILLIVVVAIAIPFRFLVLSKLNVNAGDTESALGLNKLADIPLEGSASRMDYQSIDAQRGLLFISHLGGDQVIAFDLKQQKVAAYISDVAGVHGLIAVPETGRVYAAATGTHQIAVIDENTFHVIARADGGQYPDGVAFDPENQKVFVSDESGGGVIVIDARTNQRTNRIDLGGEVGNTMYDAMGHQIVSAAQGRNQLALIDPQSEKVTSYIDLPGCSGPHGFYLDSPSRLVFVSCGGNAKLLVVDLNTKQITASDSVGEIPDVLAYDTGLHRLYVAAESGVVAVFQTRGATLEKIGQTYLAPNAHTIAVDSQTHRVYLPLENIDGRPVLRIYEPSSTAGK